MSPLIVLYAMLGVGNIGYIGLLNSPASWNSGGGGGGNNGLMNDAQTIFLMDDAGANFLIQG